jgi:hypothetical protein
MRGRFYYEIPHFIPDQWTSGNGLYALMYTAKKNSGAILKKLEELAPSEFIKEANGILRI